MTVKYRFVQRVEGQWIVTEVRRDNLAPWLEARGFTVDGALDAKHYRTGQARRTPLRAELDGQPIIRGLCGPAWDGDAVRYEDSDANDILSA